MFMSTEISSDPLAVEAANSETSPKRLAELSRVNAVRAIVASNPSTPRACLAQMSKAQNAVIRRAVAQNPNTPVLHLTDLVYEFPRTFLNNPVITLLSLAEPDFIKNISLPAWLQLLRCE